MWRTKWNNKRGIGVVIQLASTEESTVVGRKYQNEGNYSGIEL
ncbi:uncharacterized protein G2W53_019560 [Senna tora]|uniref:Uncharacterized protein n=1 Tax=Senna tora TaxID=362788 RepID=A0A834WQW2_9FABA|nr:uncharacterized protein G2W53_019560 [Senna tora]